MYRSCMWEPRSSIHTKRKRETNSPCARDRKFVLILQSVPWHVTEIGRQFEEESRENGVDRGNDGLARRVCLLFRPSSVSFSFSSWTNMFTEEHESVNFGVFVWWPVNFDFFSTLLKSMENSTCSSIILWHFQAQSLNLMLLWSCSQPTDQVSPWSAKFWTQKASFRRTRPWKIGLDFPNPREETHNVRHNVGKRGGKKRSDKPLQPLMTQSPKDLMPLKKCAGVNER